MARPARALRSAHHRLQPLCALGAARHMEGDLRWPCRTLRRQPILHRLVHRQGSPRGGRRKRGELAQDIGRSRGGRTSKVHAVVDESGRPRCLIITDGQVHDSQVMPSLLDGAGNSIAVVADKAYGSHSIRQHINDQGAIAVIPSKSNARKPIPHDKGLYRMRNIVERFFCTMKDMRRLATRFEKLSTNFLAMVHIFAIRLWIN